MHSTWTLTCSCLRFLVVLTMFSGCSLLPQTPKTPMRTYVLHLDGASAATAATRGCGETTATLLVNLPRTHAGIDTPRMAYLLQPYEINYYADNQWADTPARLFAPLLVRALEQGGCWRTVVQMPAAVHGDYRLDTELVQWQQEFFSSPSRIHLNVRVQLVAQDGQEVLASRRFDVLESAPSEDAVGAALAANRAVDTLLQQIVRWVNEQPTANMGRVVK